MDGPLVVRSGRTVRHGLIMSNLTDRDLTVLTNGQLTATIIDPGSGRDVGGFAGAQAMPLVVFPVPAGAAQRIPMLVATASFTPDLGYVIPPGTWAIRVILDLDGGRRLRTPALPVTVTA